MLTAVDKLTIGGLIGPTGMGFVHVVQLRPIRQKPLGQFRRF